MRRASRPRAASAKEQRETWDGLLIGRDDLKMASRGGERAPTTAAEVVLLGRLMATVAVAYCVARRGTVLALSASVRAIRGLSHATFKLEGLSEAESRF